MKVNNNEYFKSRTAEFIFYLLELDGALRVKKLGIKKYHYSNKKAADEWKKDVLSMMEEDHPMKKQALEMLEEIYELMITR